MSDTLHRNTRQRTAIRKVFESVNRPLSAQQVLELAQAEVDGIGIATVYRNLKTLLDEGWLTQVELPGGNLMYECAGKAHHHHFQCESCNRVYELEGCVPTIEKLARPGFKVRRHELVLYGTCATCRRPVQN
jgi:Fe2+/Zn2+ uptake regulation proteins